MVNFVTRHIFVCVCEICLICFECLNLALIRRLINPLNVPAIHFFFSFFYLQLLEKISFAFNDQIPWLQDMFGGTVDKLTLITQLLGHTVFFFGCFFAVIFIEAPPITRALLLFLVPVNLLLTLQQSEFSLDFLEMSWILAGSVPGK